MSKRQLDSIEKKMAVLKARKDTLMAAEKKMRFKHDTRRKIVAGAVVLNLAMKNEDARNRFLELVEQMPDRDKKLFDGYFENKEMTI